MARSRTRRSSSKVSDKSGNLKAGPANTAWALAVAAVAGPLSVNAIASRAVEGVEARSKTYGSFRK